MRLRGLPSSYNVASGSNSAAHACLSPFCSASMAALTVGFINLSTSICKGHSGFQLAGIDRQGADALARYGEDRIGYRWGHTRTGRFAEPTRRLHALDDVRFHHRDFIHSHGPVVVKIALLHASALERDRAVQRSRETEECPALHLCSDRVWIDHDAAIGGTDDAVNLDCAVPRDLHLRHLHHVAPEGELKRNPTTAPRRQWPAPARLFRGEVQHSEGARIVAEQRPAINNGILLRRRRQVINEAFNDEDVLHRADTAPERSGYSGRLDAHVVHVNVG